MLLIASLVVAVIVSMVGQQSGRQIIEPGSADSSAADSGSADSGTGAPGTDAGVAPDDVSPENEAHIFVHILGAVSRPGLLELHDGARVMDAVAAAGGLTEAADPAGVNLARPLTDGEQLYVPVVGEVAAGVPAAASGVAGGGPAGSGAPGGSVSGVVNLNTATVADLDTLPRIGPAMAQRILDYREANGPFQSVDELANISGIGEKTFDALKDLVTV